MNAKAAVPDIASLDLRRLKTLERVGRHGSFSKAASELHFTQSAVSQQIATLERDLGAVLVRRNPVGLTEAGTALCRRYMSALAELTAAQAELDMFREGGSSRLRIAAPAGSLGSLLTRAIATVSSGGGGPEVLVKSLGPTESIEAVERGEADVAVTYRFSASAAGGSGMLETRLTRDRLLLAVPRTHELASRSAVSLSDLGGESWIHVSELEVPQALIGEAFEERPYRPAVLLDSGSLARAQTLVGAGVGVTLVPELAMSCDPNVRYVPIAGDRVGRSIYAAVRKSAPCDGDVRAMLSALLAAAHSLARWPSFGAAAATTSRAHLRALGSSQ